MILINLYMVTVGQSTDLSIAGHAQTYHALATGDSTDPIAIGDGSVTVSQMDDQVMILAIGSISVQKSGVEQPHMASFQIPYESDALAASNLSARTVNVARGVAKAVSLALGGNNL